MLRLVVSCIALIIAVTDITQPSAVNAGPAHARSIDLSSMAFRVGTWQCTAHYAGKPRFEFVSVTDLAYDGHWLRTRTVFPAAVSLGDRPYYDDQLWTNQPEAKSWVGIDIDNTGEYSYAWSSGWVANRFTYAGYYTSQGKEIHFHGLLIKLSDRMLEERFEEPDTSGVLQLTYSDICWKSNVPTPRPLPLAP